MRYLMRRPTAIMRLAAKEEQVIGYGITLVPRLPRPARLYSLAVRPDNQGRGLGQRLLGTLLTEAAAQGYIRFTLEVRASDGKTADFYTRAGFKPIDTLPGYYQDGEAALRMMAQGLHWDTSLPYVYRSDESPVPPSVFS